MGIEFLSEYFIPVISGICLCVGQIIKVTPLPNKYIPSVNALLGLGLAIWIHWGAITPEVVLAGLFSGLAATGLYEAFQKLIGGKENAKTDSSL